MAADKPKDDGVIHVAQIMRDTLRLASDIAADFRSADLRERVARAIAVGTGYTLPGEVWESYLPEADAVLAELGLTQADPVGEWVMVPREPTLAMLGAGRAKARDGYTLEAAWEAMLAAAPKRGGA